MRGADADVPLAEQVLAWALAGRAFVYATMLCFLRLSYQRVCLS